MKTLMALLAALLVSGCSHSSKDTKNSQAKASQVQLDPDPFKNKKPNIQAGNTYYTLSDSQACSIAPGRSGPCTYAISRGHTIKVEKIESPDDITTLAMFRCDRDTPDEANCGIEREFWKNLLPASDFERAALITQSPKLLSSPSGPVIKAKAPPRVGQVLFIKEKSGQYVQVLLPDQSMAWIKKSDVSQDPKVIAAAVVMDHLYSLKKDSLEWGSTSNSILSNGCRDFVECCDSLMHEGTFYFVSLLRNEKSSYLLEKNRIERKKEQDAQEAKEEEAAWRRERTAAYEKMTPEERNQAEAEDSIEGGHATDDNETPIFVIPTADIYQIKWP